MVALGNKIKNNSMKFTWEQYGISLSIDKDNKVTREKIKVKHEHDKFAEFDKWFAKLEEKYNEEQANKYY
tara:strand:- start:1105 stop:1314 length:210 start_codon:yes stop_codon:yes gene_type:complete